MTTEHYIEKLNTRYKTGLSTEHTFRGDLQALLEAICENIVVTNEPTRIACGAPDYILTNNNIPVGYIEAKDLAANLDDKTYKEQFDRYKSSLPNLIFTNYLDFHLYREGVFVTSISIGKIENGKVIGIAPKFNEFKNLVQEFSTHTSQTIKSAEKLSKMMAGKAKMLAVVIEKALTFDNTESESKVHEEANNSLKAQYEAFREILIHDIEIKDFADIYAQTIAYGMFAARLHDPSLKTFSRQEAAELIPKTNPFLRKLFQYIAGYDLDIRIKWIVDALADIFRATDVASLLKNFGKSTQQQDPIIHFYETFLAEYDPKLRKARGVWYTPEPVVKFIVRAVDDILKSEFGLKDGLADTSKTKVKLKTLTKSTPDARSKTKEVEYEEEFHKVQILDPATGTGTFLAEIIKHIHKKFEGQQGIWNSYVDDNLIPRINGFELLMASYAMAHLKIDLLLTETGYKQQRDQRIKVFLTNSLEEHHPDTGTLFANWLSSEANEANHIKRDTPVMCVIGNPPYSISTTNKSKWIEKLIADYKKDLNERKINLDDDYIKFIRFGHHFIDKNGSGVLAYISNNSFIDGVTHRQMRKHLLESFDKIYILDLHGNARKQEVCKDGSPDNNVFDIMQGVSINIFIKTGKKKTNELGKLFHSDIQGKRESKYEYLNGNNLKSIDWESLKFTEPNFFFAPKNFDEILNYEKGFKTDELFLINNSGVKTDRDKLFIDDNKNNLKDRFINLLSGDYSQEFKNEYRVEDSGSYKLTSKIKNKKFQENFVQRIQYRPFDYKWIYYDEKLISRPAFQVFKNLSELNKENIILNTSRTLSPNLDWNRVFLTKNLTDVHTIGDQNYCFPLYIYPESNGQQTIEKKVGRTLNLNISIIKQIADRLALNFYDEDQINTKGFTGLDILDYIYAVLHSLRYREKYKEFLKIDFPRVPFPKDTQTFRKLVKLGTELRKTHLLESDKVEQYRTTYEISGNNTIEKIAYKEGKVWINKEQYFDKVPQIVWDFYIGGYQPAQKWLKDRKDSILSVEDIFHYQKIIVALTETDRIMKEIDKIEIE